MSKKNKKNSKKIHAKINNTPAKAEATKKEVSKIAKENNKTADKGAKAAANKAAKAEKQAKKYAASKARIEARNARKKGIMDKLIDSKKTNAPAVVKITLEQRKKKQEERRKIAEARHISSIKRRCKRLKLDDNTTNKVVETARKQWNSASSYNLVIVMDEGLKKRVEIEKLVKDCKIKAACITNSTAFFKEVPKSSIEKIRELIGEAVFYQYRSDNKSPFEEAGVIIKKDDARSGKKGGSPHSIECTKIRNKNFYTLRKKKKEDKKAAIEKALEDVKPVNKKPTQVKNVKSKTSKKAA